MSAGCRREKAPRSWRPSIAVHSVSFSIEAYECPLWVDSVEKVAADMLTVERRYRCQISRHDLASTRDHIPGLILERDDPVSGSECPPVLRFLCNHSFVE